MRLYKGDKKAISKKILDYTFSGKEKVLQDREYLLAEEIFNEKFSEADRLKLAQIPKGWLPTHNTIYVKVGGYEAFLNFKSEKITPYNFTSSNPYIKDHDLIKKVQVFLIDKDKLREERNKFSNKITSFLYSITTKKALLDKMPEIKEIMGEDYFRSDIPSTALVPIGKEIFCEIVHIRGEQREGCCDGKPV